MSCTILTYTHTKLISGDIFPGLYSNSVALHSDNDIVFMFVLSSTFDLLNATISRKSEWVIIIFFKSIFAKTNKKELHKNVKLFYIKLVSEFVLSLRLFEVFPHPVTIRFKLEFTSSRSVCRQAGRINLVNQIRSTSRINAISFLFSLSEYFGCLIISYIK